MNAATRAQVITRWGAVALMGAAVMTATAGGFAQSYAGLYHWALEHGLRGWKAESFPLLVDLFIIVGELGLFLLAIDAYVLHRRQLLSWLDFCLPLTIALAGWTASLVFNVGHVGKQAFSFQATAAVPPIVSMLGLFVLLRILHRYVSTSEGTEARPVRRAEPMQRAITPVTLQQINLMPLRVTGPIPQVSALETGKPALRKAEAPKAAQTPQPAPELAVVGTGVNGHTGIDTGIDTAAGELNTDLEPPQREAPPEVLRKVVGKALERHRGDVTMALAAVTAEGYRCAEDEIVRIRENHWLPYAVYRLLAKHDGDGELVIRDLTANAISYDRATLDALVRSWRA